MDTDVSQEDVELWGVDDEADGDDMNVVWLLLRDGRTFSIDRTLWASADITTLPTSVHISFQVNHVITDIRAL